MSEGQYQESEFDLDDDEVPEKPSLYSQAEVDQMVAEARLEEGNIWECWVTETFMLNRAHKRREYLRLAASKAKEGSADGK